MPHDIIDNREFYSDGLGCEFLHRLFRSLAQPGSRDRLEGILFVNRRLFDEDESCPLQACNLTVSADTPP